MEVDDVVTWNYITVVYVGWLLVVFYVSSTAKPFRDGTPIYCPMRWT